MILLCYTWRVLKGSSWPAERSWVSQPQILISFLIPLLHILPRPHCALHWTTIGESKSETFSSIYLHTLEALVTVLLTFLLHGLGRRALCLVCQCSLTAPCWWRYCHLGCYFNLGTFQNFTNFQEPTIFKKVTYKLKYIVYLSFHLTP